MSETIETGVTRRPRSDRPAREIHREDPAVVIEGGHDNLSPEDALADSRRQLQERDTQLADARKREREAQAQRQRAEAEAAQAATGRTQDRQSVVTSAMEAAKAEQTQARQNFRLAREAGDVDAEANATEALSAATFRLSQATAELDYLKSQPKEPPQPQGAPSVSSEAQRWLDDHPRFFDESDDGKDYRAYAEGLHNAALRSLGNQANGSQQYVDYIESRMAKRFGENHGHVGGSSMNGGDRPAPARGGDGIPPSRSGGGSGGWKTARVNLGEGGGMSSLEYTTTPEGGRRIRIPPRDLDNFKEGAKTAFPRLYERDPKAALGEYVNDHIDHVLEGSPDLKIGDGRVYGGDNE